MQAHVLKFFTNKKVTQLILMLLLIFGTCLASDGERALLSEFLLNWPYHIAYTVDEFDLPLEYLLIGHSGFDIGVDLSEIGEVTFNVPGLSGFSFNVSGKDDIIDDKEIVAASYEFANNYGALLADFELTLPSEILEPVDGSDNAVFNWDSLGLDLVGNLLIDSIIVNSAEGYKFAGTDFIVKFDTIGVDLSLVENLWSNEESTDDFLDEAFANEGTEWKGICIYSAEVTLPDELGEGNIITISHAAIGSGGFTGKIFYDNVGLTMDIGGFSIEVTKIRVTFIRGVLSECEIHGNLTLPFFEHQLAVIGMYGSDDQFMFKAKSTPADTLVKLVESDDWLEIIAESIAISRDSDGDYFVSVDGSIKSKHLGLDGFDFSGLQIFGDGSFNIPGGWFNLPNFSSFKFGSIPFPFTLKKFNFGKGGDWKWLGLGGNFQFPDFLPIGINLHAIKIKWPELGDISSFSFDDFTFEIPEFGIELTLQKILEVEGRIAYADTAFEGECVITVIPWELELEGRFIGGRTTGEDALKYFYINLGTQFPSGIPLGATNLALYGVNGGYGDNFKPFISEDWLRTVMWVPEKGQTFQAGVTLGTASDNGYTLNSDLTFTVSIPGPIIMFQGDGWILQDRFERKDPNARALICWDNTENMFLIALEGHYKVDPDKGNTIKVDGNFELLISPNKWHVYLGQKPLDKRIRAEIFNLLKANGYFMVGNDVPISYSSSAVGEGIAMGAYFELEADLWIAYLRAILANDLEWTWRPKHVYAHVLMEGELGIRVCGIGFNLAVGTDLEGCYPDPAFLLGDFRISIGFPYPMDDFNMSFKLKLGEGDEGEDIDIELLDAVESILVYNPVTEECDTLWTCIDPEKINYLSNVPLDAQFVVNFIRPIIGWQEGDGDSTSLAQVTQGSSFDVRSDFNETRIDTFLTPTGKHQKLYYRFNEVFLEKGQGELTLGPPDDEEDMSVIVDTRRHPIKIKKQQWPDVYHDIIHRDIIPIDIPKQYNKIQNQNNDMYNKMPHGPMEDSSSPIESMDSEENEINTTLVNLEKHSVSYLPNWKYNVTWSRIAHQGGWGSIAGLDEEGKWENERRRRVYTMHHTKWPSDVDETDDNNVPDGGYNQYWQPASILEPNTLYAISLKSTSNKSISSGIELPDNVHLLDEKIAFRTGLPPEDLSPYIAWTSPPVDYRPVFRNHDINISFNKPYIFEMYPDLDIIVVDENDDTLSIEENNIKLEAENEKIVVKENLEKQRDVYRCKLANELSSNALHTVFLFDSTSKDTLYSYSFITSRYSNFAGMIEEMRVDTNIVETTDGGTMEQLQLTTSEPIDWRRIKIKMLVEKGADTFELNFSNRRLSGDDETEHVFRMVPYPTGAEKYKLIFEYDGLGNDIWLLVQNIRTGNKAEKSADKIVELIREIYAEMSDDDRNKLIELLNRMTGIDNIESQLGELHEKLLETYNMNTLHTVENYIAQLIEKYQTYIEPQTINGNYVVQEIDYDISFLWNGE